MHSHHIIFWRLRFIMAEEEHKRPRCGFQKLCLLQPGNFLSFFITSVTKLS